MASISSINCLISSARKGESISHSATANAGFRQAAQVRL
jgi:hypothetical protein